MILPVNIWKGEGSVILQWKLSVYQTDAFDLTAAFLLGPGHLTHGILSLHHLRLSIFSPSLWGWKTQTSLLFLLFSSHPHPCHLTDLSCVPQPGLNLRWKPRDQELGLILKSHILLCNSCSFQWEMKRLTMTVAITPHIISTFLSSQRPKTTGTQRGKWLS